MSEEATLDEFADSSEEQQKKPQQPESRFWGEIPEGWELVNGSEVYDVNPNPKPSEEPNTYIEMDALDTELPWPKYFGERNASEYSGKTFSEGDTLFARITPCTENGKAAFVPEMETEVGIGSTEYAVLSPKIDRIHPWLLYYLGKSYPVHNYAVSRMRGSTGRQRVPFSVFRRELDIALPPVEEQRKIATVLYTIDRAIEKTEETIEQRTRVKKGLMQDLFRYGLDEDGKLRSSDSNSEPYRKTKYGEIPESWDIVPLNQLVPEDAPIVYGILKPGDHQPDGVPVVKVKDIHDGEVKQGDLLHTSHEIHEDFKRAELREGDLLFTIRGTVGRMAFVPESLDGGNITQDTARIRVTEANPRFIRYFFETETPNNYFERNTIGQAVQGINLEDLREVPVHLPSEEEQARIVEIIDQHSESLRNEREYRQSLQRLKQGLMQDLLSGTVRTTDTNIAVPEEIAQHG
ncbi:restriction endonuclease subunit S [Haloplanus natans]|uniref:restriction endonuclease subunit S n=1 Tax=Haloplanus natans TaxID=376171 RepID=UPI0006782793|nr:restriction endonuclease subunit S [Haloplanus natans]